MKQTPNYNLPILEAGDKYLKDYQNDAFSVIDTELKAMNDKINTLDNVEGSILETSQGLKNTNAELDKIKNKANFNAPSLFLARIGIIRFITETSYFPLLPVN